MAAWVDDPDCWTGSGDVRGLESVCHLFRSKEVPVVHFSWTSCGDGCEVMELAPEGVGSLYGDVDLFTAQSAGGVRVLASTGMDVRGMDPIGGAHLLTGVWVLDLKGGTILDAVRLDAALDPITGSQPGCVLRGEGWVTLATAGVNELPAMFDGGRMVWFGDWRNFRLIGGPPIQGRFLMDCHGQEEECLVSLDGSEMAVPAPAKLTWMGSDGERLYESQPPFDQDGGRDILTWRPGETTWSPLLHRDPYNCTFMSADGEVAGIDTDAMYCQYFSGATLWRLDRAGVMHEYHLETSDTAIDSFAAAEGYIAVLLYHNNSSYPAFVVVTREDGAQRRIRTPAGRSLLVQGGFLYIAENVGSPNTPGYQIRRFDLSRWDALGTPYP